MLESPRNLTVCPARTQMLEVGLHVIDHGVQRPLYLWIKFCKQELADFDGDCVPTCTFCIHFQYLLELFTFNFERIHSDYFTPAMMENLQSIVQCNNGIVSGDQCHCHAINTITKDNRCPPSVFWEDIAQGISLFDEFAREVCKLALTRKCRVYLPCPKCCRYRGQWLMRGCDVQTSVGHLGLAIIPDKIRNIGD